MEHESVDYDDINEGVNHSESKEGESSYDEYASDFDSSHCSITSVLEDDHLHEAITRFSDTPAVHAVTLQAHESANTTWTDDKHSSYLDSIEATFVRKMYDKEYCSLDFCGHSSQSSITSELECVESHPFCLNSRKPYEQPVGLLPFRALTRPWLSTSAVLASPCIQHFKAKQVVSGKNSEAQGNETKTELPNISASTKDLHQPTSTMHDTISNAALLKSNLLVSKKRATLFDSSDCMESEVNFRSPHGTIAGGFKKLKCQQALSRMDMVMEEQYNIEQQIQETSHLDQQNEGKVPSDVTKEELRMLQTGVFEADESRKSNEAPQTSSFKEQQAKIVPSFKDCRKEAREQSILLDKALPSKEVHDMYRPSGDNGAYIAEEDDLSSHSSEQDNTSTQLGSKTWTWGTQGLRYRLAGTMSPINFKY